MFTLAGLQTKEMPKWMQVRWQMLKKRRHENLSRKLLTPHTRADDVGVESSGHQRDPRRRLGYQQSAEHRPGFAHGDVAAQGEGADRIIGVPDIESVTVQTSYAKMQIPLEEIATLEIGGDHEHVEVRLQNGDRLTGVILLRRLPVQGVFGRLSLGRELVRRVTVWP